MQQLIFQPQRTVIDDFFTPKTFTYQVEKKTSNYGFHNRNLQTIRLDNLKLK